ncbi:hypothetical protein D6810_00160 [Candidatus Dojkabacteria bacterium]|uniref:Uncharacterized protein n=1 Tax=Candidatus Dojkabacteria bacterium TaxID=2099670 RepID=A0A3M0Z072_9BACT|nr:MAG: hypothetical protein D6810_00160 [Candidatus Dojkabacteria bacterium]
MAATPKHRRSLQKSRSTKASDRYNKFITLLRKVRKYGGTLFCKNSKGEPYRPHTVSKNSKTYKGIKVLE